MARPRPPLPTLDHYEESFSHADNAAGADLVVDPADHAALLPVSGLAVAEAAETTACGSGEAAPDDAGDYVPFTAATDIQIVPDAEIPDFDPDHPFANEEPLTAERLQLIHDLPFGYLAGDAGTGKSYLAKRYAELADDGMLIATTGIAAVNLGGITINSALRYFDTDSMQLQYELGQLGAAIRMLAESGIRRLIVDEISMMDGNQLDILSLALNDINEARLNAGKDPIGVWLTGDFAQLPPVGVDNKPTPGAQFPTIYAFQAANWKQWADNTITLTEVRRQADADFIRAIQQVRRGDKSCVDYFRQFITKSEDVNYLGTSIMAKNDEVDRYNKIRMLKINAQEDLFTAIFTGEPKQRPGEWKHIPEKLFLKPGCLVMILANKREPGGGAMIYANGDLGVYLEKISDHHARVRLHRNGQEVIVTATVRERLKPGIPRTERRKEVIDPEYILASIDYMPLRVAYASTVHKSQGLSLDNVQVLINSQFWMSSGMLYVGLSRARTPQGLRIVGTVDQFVARVRANPLVKEWL